MIRKKIFIVILILCTCAGLCGADWFKETKVMIDTEKDHVYKYCTADEIISEFMADHKGAKETYQKEYVLLSGKVTSIGKGGKSIILSGNTEAGLTIACSYNKELRKSALELAPGDSIALYGQITVDAFRKDIHLKAQKIIKPPSAVISKDVYYLLDGSCFDKEKAKKVTLHSEGVEYYIPLSWNEVEHNIMEEELGTIEGYQYVLNKINGNPDPVPESLFVCYFHNKEQLADHLNDSDKTELIEKAIVENILGEVRKFPSKKVKTYYNSVYTYYSGVYRKTIETGAGYHTEFVFQADDDEGIVLILYVYKDAEHISDVLFLTRFLEIKKRA